MQIRGTMSSVNQSGLRKTVGRNEDDVVSNGIRGADLIAGAFFLGLNIIAKLGEFTGVFAKFGRVNSGIAFLYETFCYPMSLVVSHFFSLKGDPLYVWIIAELVFILTASLLWLIIVIISALFKSLRS